MDKTAFATQKELYGYTCVSLCFKNPPATSQRAIDIILGPVKWQHALVYTDDAVIFSNIAEEHLNHVDSILQLINKAGMTLELKKFFFLDENNYLEHVITVG